VLGDLHYYDDELEEAEAYYKNAVHTLHIKEMTLEQLYAYVRNMLRLGIIYEKRKQYDFAYLTYGELCERIIRERDIAFNKLGIGVVLRKNKKNKIIFVRASSRDKYLSLEERMYYDNIEVSPILPGEEQVSDSLASLHPLNFKNITPNTNAMLFKKMTFEGLKVLYLPLIAKLQIIEKSHIGGITRNHLQQLDKEFKLLTFIIDRKEAKYLEAEFYSRVADILFYKNSDLNNSYDLKCKKNKKNSSCTACNYYLKALSILLGKTELIELKNRKIVLDLLYAAVEQIEDSYNMKFCTILARILSDWGNVFFSCDTKNQKGKCGCYICDAKDCNTRQKYYHCSADVCDTSDCKSNRLAVILRKYIIESGNVYRDALLKEIKKGEKFTKREIAFTMYAISSEAYRKANLYKRSSFQLYKMLCLFRDYEIYKKYYIDKLSKKAIHYLWHANEDLNLLELNKRKKDFNKKTFKEKIPLQNLLVDTEITRIRVLVEELRLKSEFNDKKLADSKALKKYFDMRITSPYRINYSIVARIYRLRLKSRACSHYAKG